MAGKGCRMTSERKRYVVVKLGDIYSEPLNYEASNILRKLKIKKFLCWIDFNVASE